MQLENEIVANRNALILGSCNFLQEYCLYEDGLSITWPSDSCGEELTSLNISASDADLELAQLSMEIDFERTQGW